MDTSRRSATGAGCADDAPRFGCAEPKGVSPATSGVAHSPQNFDAAPLAAPHVGQIAASRVAHSPQNFRPASFSVPQFEQTTPASRAT